VHEIHHNEAKHHSASALPAVSMDEFKRSGGSLKGREERSDAFEGEPRAVGSTLGSGTSSGTGILGGHGAAGSTHLTEKNGIGHKHNDNGVENRSLGNDNAIGTDGTTTKKASLMDKINPKVDSNGDGQAGFMK
jgi:hypothetical protein